MSDAIKLLRELEWCGRVHSQGTCIGDLGPLVRCCPICGGIHPGDWYRGWSDDAKGHKKNCRLVPFLAPKLDVSNSEVYVLKQDNLQAVFKEEYDYVPSIDLYDGHRIYKVHPVDKETVSDVFAKRVIAALLDDLCFRNKLKSGSYIITAG